MMSTRMAEDFIDQVETLATLKRNQMNEMKAIPQFSHDTDFEFKDISSEEYREYVFPHGTVRINSPLKLAITPRNSHRVFDMDGVSHIIPAGWLELRWQVKPGSPNFKF